MICATCGSKTAHIKVIEGKEYCSHCGGFSEAGGTKTDGLLTRNRFSIRRESIQREADMIPPHEYDRTTRKVKPRDEFIKRYPDKVGEYFSQEELNKAGYNKLKAKPLVKRDENVEHHGDAKERIKEII